MNLVAVVILSLGAWRAVHFVILDSLIEETRAKWTMWLTAHSAKLGWRKLLELATCPWCMSVWFALVAVLLWRWQDADSIGWFDTIVMWGGVAGGSMAAWQTWDDDD